MNIQATLALTKSDLNKAVEEWLQRQGITTTDRFHVQVKTTPGDRPFDPEYTEITVTGVRLGGVE